MLIDIHTHITHDEPRIAEALGRSSFTVDTLLRRMDFEGIDKSVVLPLVNPENYERFAVADNTETIAACLRHPDRLIPFCNIDPRMMLNSPEANLSTLIDAYKGLGCLGIGEVCAALPFTDPRYKNLFRHAAACGMPVLFHLTGLSQGVYGVIDPMGMPGLEESLREFPDTVFIGHAMAFWSEIAADVSPEERDHYPKGPVKKPGRLCELLERYSNLYGDLSAGSGYNAIARDPEFGYGFLEKFNRRLFFGTDRFTSPDEPVPEIIAFLKNGLDRGKLSAVAYDNITHKNFLRVFGER